MTKVDDPSGESAYTVTFNQSLANSVVHATPGVGNPTGNAQWWFDVIPSIQTNPLANDPKQVKVTFVKAAAPATAIDTSFVITAFC